jgi:hypothetical protein
VLTQQLQQPITELAQVHNTAADAAITATQLLLLLLILATTVSVVNNSKMFAYSNSFVTGKHINIYNTQKHVMGNFIGGPTEIKKTVELSL